MHPWARGHKDERANKYGKGPFMPWVAILIPIFVLQIVLATIVIFFLLKTLDRNLTEMGIIRLENWPFERKIIKASNVEVLTSKNLKPLVDRKSTRLNSSHSSISYAVFC